MLETILYGVLAGVVLLMTIGTFLTTIFAYCMWRRPPAGVCVGSPSAEVRPLAGSGFSRAFGRSPKIGAARRARPPVPQKNRAATLH
jgi:hypothetical protein